jgi:hypothetical protein
MLPEEKNRTEVLRGMRVQLKSEGGRGMSSAGLFPLHKEVFNLVEVLETAKLPRAIERFIN